MNGVDVVANGWQPWLLAGVTYLLSMLVVGLLSAYYRLSALHRNGLLEAEALAGVPRQALARPRRFLLAVGTIQVLLTAMGAAALYAAVASVRPGWPVWRLLLTAGVAVSILWSLGGALVKLLAADASLHFVRVVGTLVWPLIWLLGPWAALLAFLFRRVDDSLWSTDALQHLTTGEIRNLLADDSRQVALEEEEREMIHSIFSFHETAVREIMVPRIDMVALAVDTPVREALRTVVTCRHSRIPLFEGNVDRVTGLLYSKDLLALVEGDTIVAPDRQVGELAREAYFIPESKRLDEVLAELRAKRIHMAVVIDEYGGTAGIVTLEDVIEEIVGEIEDEFDTRETLWEWLDERTLRVDPKIDLDDLEEVLGVELPRDGNETLGGLVYEAAGRVPVAGDSVTIAGLEVTVDTVEDQRILQVTLRAPEPLPGHRAPQREAT